MRRLVGSVLVLALAGCAQGEPVAAPPSPTAESPSLTPAASPSPTPTPSPSPQTAFELGETARTPKGNRVTVLSWDTNTGRPIDPDPGKQFSQVEIKFCLSKKEQPLDASSLMYAFTLSMPNGLRVTTESSGYRGDEIISQSFELKPGDCTRGFIIYQSPAGKRPKYVMLPVDGPSDFRWKVR
jgi:hypothetical protein